MNCSKHPRIQSVLNFFVHVIFVTVVMWTSLHCRRIHWLSLCVILYCILTTRHSRTLRLLLDQPPTDLYYRFCVFQARSDVFYSIAVHPDFLGPSWWRLLWRRWKTIGNFNQCDKFKNPTQKGNVQASGKQQAASQCYCSQSLRNFFENCQYVQAR